MPPTSDPNAAAATTPVLRRAFVAATRTQESALLALLTAAGYEPYTSMPTEALAALGAFPPDVVLAELPDGALPDPDFDGLAFATQLRAHPATAALPLVLLYHTDTPAARAGALSVGADDYCALALPPAELRARLAALHWRTEAGRRAATLAARPQRAEIDDFLGLLDAVNADIASGAGGALALVAATTPAAAHDTTATERLLAAAHEFLSLNLRRLDNIAFYGPTLLLVYLPQRGPGTASAALARLRDEFMATRPGALLSVGLATFPADGCEVETLIEQAETTLAAARPALPDTPSGPATAAAATPQERGPRAPAAFKQGRAVRESRRPDALETAVMPDAPATSAQYGAAQALAQVALAAAARERDLRVQGARMPRRLLLTVSDAARMAQVNLLLRSAGYEVRAASDAQQALNLLRIERPDLLVLDYDLHGFDGLEVLRRLRGQHAEQLPLPVVLFLPADERRTDLFVAAARAGVRGVVALPYDPAELLERIRTVGGAA